MWESATEFCAAMDRYAGRAARIKWPVMQALTRAADRGVHIRTYLDGTRLAERGSRTLL
jgi:hypothetical protein